MIYMGLLEKLWGGAGEIVDRGASTVVGTGSILGGVVLGGASGTASLYNDAALSIGFVSEEKHAATQETLDSSMEAARGLAGGGAVQLLNVVTDPVDLEQSVDDAREEGSNPSERFWNLFFGDTADDFGNTLTLATLEADEEITGEGSTEDDYTRRKEQIRGWEDEILFAIFSMVPVAKIPALRNAIAVSSPAIFAAIANSVDTGVGLAAEVLNLILGRIDVPNIDIGDKDEDPVVEEPEEEPQAEEPVDEDPVEDQPEEPVEETVDMPKEVMTPEVQEPTEFYASMGLDKHNKFVEREIFY